MSTQQAKPQNDARRRFLKQSGIAIGGVVVGGVIGGSIIGSRNGQPKVEEKVVDRVVEKPVEKIVEKIVEKPKPVYYHQALLYFSPEQFEIADAAAERIFPKDDQGAGAKEIGAAYYIDHQLAGPWGMNAKDYMMGPFAKGEPTQGTQTHLTRTQIFTIGLKALQDYSQEKWKKNFAELAPAEQDEALKVFEKGSDVKLEAISTSAFFNLLRTFTIEGIYSDPVYGGNKDMLGWQLKRYPGNQMGYDKDIEKDGFIVMEPKSLYDHMMGH